MSGYALMVAGEVQEIDAVDTEAALAIAREVGEELADCKAGNHPIFIARHEWPRTHRMEQLCGCENTLWGEPA